MQLVDLSRRHIALYRAALAQAARESEALLSRVLVATQRSLHEDLEHARTLPERDQLQVSIKLLDENSSLMCQSYPQILKDLFEKKRRVDSQFGVLGVGELNLDDLEHMDAAEVHERVEMARTLQFEPKNKLAPFNIGFIYLEHLSNYPKAVKYFTDAIRSDSTYVDAIYNRGLSYERMKDMKSARSDYSKALRINSEYEMAIAGMNRLDDKYTKSK